MGGTQNLVEGSVPLVAQTVLSASSSEKNSLQGINVNALTDGALCFVRENGTVYRYYQASSLASAPPLIVQPSTGSGRWLAISTDPATASAYGPSHGRLLQADLTGATTQALAGDTVSFVTLAVANWSLDAASVDFTMPSAGVLQYNGLATRYFRIDGHISCSFGSQISVSAGIGVGGTPTDDTAPQSIGVPASGDAVQLSVSQDVVLATSGTVRLRLRSNTAPGGQALIIQSAELLATPIG